MIACTFVWPMNLSFMHSDICTTNLTNFSCDVSTSRYSQKFRFCIWCFFVDRNLSSLFVYEIQWKVLYCIWSCFRCICKIADTQLLALLCCLSVCLSVHLHVTTQLPLDQVLRNLIFECFLKIGWENSSFFKIWQQ